MAGNTTDTDSQDQIRAFVDRILRMKEEAKAINDDIREIYAEAKGNGFDKTALGKLVNYVEKRAKDSAAVAEADAIFDLYLEAYDGTPSRTHAHEAASVAASTPAAGSPVGELGAAPGATGTGAIALTPKADAASEATNITPFRSKQELEPPHPDCQKPELCKGFSNLKLCETCRNAAAGFVQISHQGDVA